MNVTLDRIDNVNGKVTIAIEEKDYQDKVAKELKKIGQTHKIDGFRPGHVPAGMLKKMFGKSVLVEVINREVYDALTNYIEENKLNILGEPIIENTNKIDFDKDKDFTFNFVLGFAPEINAKVDKDVKMPYYFVEVDDDMMTRQDEAMTERFGKQVPGEEVDEKALVKGSMVELNEDGSVKEGGINVEKTIVSPAYFKSEDQRKLFIGKKLNDKVVFNPSATCEGNVVELASMLNIDKDKANVASNFEMTITEIVVLKKAEHNQEFFDSVFGKDVVKSEEEYIAKLKSFIAEQLINDSNYRFAVDTEEILKAQVGSLELPKEFLKKWLMQKDEKYNAENIDAEFEKMVPQLEWHLIKEQVMQNLNVQVKDEDVEAEAKVLASQQFAQYGMTNVPADALENYAKEMLKNENYRRSIVDRTVENKFFESVKNAVTLEEKTVPVAEFNALFENK